VNSNKGTNYSQNSGSSQNNRTASSPKLAPQRETVSSPTISSPSTKRKEVTKEREQPTNNAPSRSDQSQFNTPLSRIFAKSSGNSAGNKDGDVEFLTHAVVEKKARGILNKITPDNFQRLSKDLVTLSVDVGYAYANNANINFNEEYCQTYSTLLQLIFDKAIDEDRYTTLYALLVQQLLKNDDTFESKSGAHFSIESKKKRDLFLNKLQTDLFKNRYNRYVKTCTGEGVSLRAAALMDHSPQATAEREVKAKRCLLGSMNFIGALFEYNECNGMSSTIIHACVTELLKGASESDIANKINKQKYGQATSDILEKSWILDIECAADLLVKTGAKLEGEHAKATMKVDVYIGKLDKMKTNENLPSRVRFLIHDILDLRKTKWVTETNQANERINRIKGGNQLKSVDEVRKEAITKLYGADPRMGNTPNRLMDELMNGNSSNKKEKKSARPRHKRSFFADRLF
jgi:translation initiation factor 4G